MSTDYLKQAKSFLSQNATRMALQVVPMALVAVSAAHAVPSPITFNAPNSVNVTAQNDCSGGSASGAGTLGGTPTYGGISLFGTGTLTNNTSSGTCTMLMTWKGTGSGNLASANYLSNFVVATPGNAAISSITLTIKINGVSQVAYTCSQSVQPTSLLHANSRVNPKGDVLSGCAGPISVPLTTMGVTGNLSTWEADLSVTGDWFNATATNVTVTVPSDSSIDLGSTAAVVPATVPALSPAAMVITAILLGLVALRLKSAGAAAPGPQA